MAGWKEVCVDYLISKLTGGKIKFGSKGTYVNSYSLIDFADDDLVNKRALLGAIAPPPLPTPITKEVTAIPLVVTYDDSLYTSAKYALIRASDASYDWNTKVQWVSGTFTVTGDDFGDGTFSDSFTFLILP